MIFLNSASCAVSLVFYLPGVCTHTDTEEYGVMGVRDGGGRARRTVDWFSVFWSQWRGILLVTLLSEWVREWVSQSVSQWESEMVTYRDATRLNFGFALHFINKNFFHSFIWIETKQSQECWSNCKAKEITLLNEEFPYRHSANNPSPCPKFG